MLLASNQLGHKPRASKSLRASLREVLPVLLTPSGHFRLDQPVG